MHYLGAGMPEDFMQACAWWRLAAAQGHSSGQLNLGIMYDEGQGMPESVR